MAIEDVIPSLVPSRRFGAALHAHRVATGAALAAVSRRCEGWWTPDELLDVERGVVGLDDASVVSFCRIYGLGGRGIGVAGDLELVLDRSESADLSDLDGDIAEPDVLVRRTMLRLGALATIVGLDAGELAVSQVVMGALDLDAGDVASASAAAWADHRALDEAVELLEDRVAVPSVGLSISDTPRGALLLVRRAGGSVRPCPAPVPAAGPLRWFTSVAVAA